MRHTRWATAALASTIALGSTAIAPAHDSLAPHGAPHTWLPKEQWVARHWIPFDEQLLKRELGLRGRELEAYLYDDHRTLAALARRRGIAPEQLADRVLAPWGLPAGDARLALLRDRALRILTQGHLAQHMFFHVFHGVGLRSAARSVFGVSGARYWRLRKRGHTPLGIARRGGVPAAAARTRMARLLRAHHDEGIRLGMASPLEADRILRRQLRALGCWLRRPLAGHDHANPYGKARLHHGGHGTHRHMTPARRRRAARRIERVRRSLPKSCWKRPPAWVVSRPRAGG
jgi:hypothetical protein